MLLFRNSFINSYLYQRLCPVCVKPHVIIPKRNYNTKTLNAPLSENPASAYMVPKMADSAKKKIQPVNVGLEFVPGTYGMRIP